MLRRENPVIACGPLSAPSAITMKAGLPDMHLAAPERRIELIDFGSETPSDRLSYADRIVHGGLTITRCLWQSNDGMLIGALQHTVIIHEGEQFEMEWRLPERRQTDRRWIVDGDIHVNPADRPVFFRWTASPMALVIALDRSFIEPIVSNAFDGNRATLKTMIATRDPVIEAMAVAWRKELVEGGAGGRLYAEGLGSALVVHLFRAYGDGLKQPPLLIGGLGTLRLRRVADYIEAHLAEDISLTDLAAVAGLSTHHFGEAFKASAGISPYRYLIDQRVRRAKKLLLGTDHSIARIALEAGFASHSHFADHFRKLTGTTPSRYRIEQK